MNYLIISSYSYLLGSIPTAYILMKLFRGIDIRRAGSGNVGGLNAYEVSGSFLLGFSVFAIDFLKGLLAVILTKHFMSESFIGVGLSVFWSVLGHCFSIWINFRGGRGLATALGSTFLFIPLAFVIWGITWLVVYILKKDIHLGNVLATILTLSLLIMGYDLVKNFTFPAPDNFLTYLIIVVLVLSIILIKHFEPIKQIISKKNYSYEREL